MPFWVPQGLVHGIPESVFVFFTTLYRRDTLSADCRIKHKSPVSWQFGKVFP